LASRDAADALRLFYDASQLPDIELDWNREIELGAVDAGRRREGLRPAHRRDACAWSSSKYPELPTVVVEIMLPSRSIEKASLATPISPRSRAARR